MWAMSTRGAVARQGPHSDIGYCCCCICCCSCVCVCCREVLDDAQLREMGKRFLEAKQHLPTR
jgi:hypothetical protein